MNFTFLHCADLHLGSPLLGLSEKDAAVAERFAAASRAAFSALVDEAIEAKVAFVLIAGDVYDGEWKDNSIGLFFNREVSRLRRAEIPVFLIKGNHDAESVVTSAIKLPDNVAVFSTRRPETHLLESLRVALHGRSFPDRAVHENWAVEYPAPKSGWFNIGLLHTSCDGRVGHATYAPCTVRDLTTRGYDYWALGHVHEYEILARDPWVVYPGNLQGRSIRECGAKGAVLVDVEDGRIVGEPRRLIVDRARFAELRIDVSEAVREEEVLRSIRSQAEPIARSAVDRLIAARVRLTDALPLQRFLQAGRAQFADEVRSVLLDVHADFWLEKLVIETRSSEFASSNGDLSALDLPATLARCAETSEFRQQAADLLAHIAGKLPSPAKEAEVSLDAIVAEARNLVLGRIGGGAA